jgi:hypothetical protein
MPPSIPRLADHLPELCEFVQGLARRIEVGELQDSNDLRRQITAFYSIGRSHAIERVAPGWKSMAAYAEGATRNHITEVMIALQLLPEYRRASDDLQARMEWAVLYHDVGKQVISGQRDALHGFRGGTLAARALPAVGFPATDAYASLIDPWSRTVLEATTAAADGKGLVQDNGRLPEIVDGIERMFGADSAAAQIVQTVMLHQSLNVVPEWPNPGSVSEAELARCIRPSLVPLLEAMMLVDSDAWQLFDPASKARFRASTLAVFAALRGHLHG